MRKAYPNELIHSSSPIVYRGKEYDKAASNYLKNSGSAEEQMAITAIINKITDPAIKSMLKQASAESILNWCKHKQKEKLELAKSAGSLYKKPITKQPGIITGWRDEVVYGLTEADLVKLMSYARKGLTYGTRPTYAEPDYQRAKIDAENDRYNRTYNTARMQTNANRRRKLTTNGRKR